MNDPIDLNRERERAIDAAEVRQECEHDDSALNDHAQEERAQIIASTVVGAADVLICQPGCDVCGKPLGVHRLLIRVAGMEFNHPCNLCLSCANRIALSIKRRLNS